MQKIYLFTKDADWKYNFYTHIGSNKTLINTVCSTRKE